MTKAFDKIMAGAEDALAYAKGDTSRGRTHIVEVVDVKAVRKKLGMTQNEFAETFHVSAGTVKNWEQKRRALEGPAKTLMYIISKEPEAVKRALAVS